MAPHSPPDGGQLYRVFAENTPDAIVTIDEASTVLSVNPAAVRLFGWPEEELLGHSLAQLMPERMREQHRQGMVRYMATGRRNIPWNGIRLPILTKDGREVECEITFGEFSVEGRRMFSGVIRDLSSQIAAEEASRVAHMQLQDQATELEQQSEEAQALAEELEHTNDELQVAVERAESAQRRAEFLARATQELASSLDYRSTIAAVVRAAVPTLADWCAVDLLADPDDAQWPPEVQRLAIHHSDPAKLALARSLEQEYPRDWSAETGLSGVLRTGEPLFVPEIPDEMIRAAARDKRHLELLRSLRLMSIIIVPLEADHRRLGALTLATTESARRFSREDLLLAREIAARAASAVYRAQLYDEAVRARKDAEDAADRMHRLQTVTASLARATTREAVGKGVLGEGLTVLGASSGFLCCMTTDRTRLEIVHEAGVREHMARIPRVFPVDAPLPLAEVVRSGTSRYLETKQELLEAFPALRELEANAPTEAWAVIPLLVHGEPTGSVAWGFAERRAFSPDDRSFLETIAAQCAQALERLRLLGAEREARGGAEAANRAKSEFLASMSHELRTPLNAITGHVQLVQLGIHGPLSDGQHHALERVQRSAAHLLALINDVLNFAKLESGRLSYSIAEVDVAPTVQELGELLAPEFRTKDLRFDHARCTGAPRVCADRDKLHQILLNLLSNAIKFTPAGGSIEVGCDTHERTVDIVVSDTGPGIPAGAMESIFAPFVQVNRTLKSVHEGAGLGLSISRELARAMGGEVTVESEVGAGAVFTLTLPRAR